MSNCFYLIFPVPLKIIGTLVVHAVHSNRFQLGSLLADTDYYCFSYLNYKSQKNYFYWVLTFILMIT